MHDEYGEEIYALSEGQKGDPLIPTFGRELKNPFDCGQNPVKDITPYWNDPAFLEHCNRFFQVCMLEDAAPLISDIHNRGKDALIKSTRSKHAIIRVPIGSSLQEAMGDLVYSFIDGGPPLMVQEWAEIQYEHRFFVIDREVVTCTPTQASLTPLDYPLPFGTMYHSTRDSGRVIRYDVFIALQKFAEHICAKMADAHVSIDCAIINGRPGVIEMHPTKLGQLGLFASNVKALARASRILLKDYQPSPMTIMDEEEFSDEPFKL